MTQATRRLSVTDDWGDRIIAERTSNNGASTHDSPSPAIDRYKPFPLDALPEPVRTFVRRGAEAIGCDTAYIALPVLSVLSAAIGNTRRIELKKGWTEPAIVWAAIVGESGTMKSPAFALALQPVRDRQDRAMVEYAERLKDYERERLIFDRDLSDWKRGKSDSNEPPSEPERPIAERFLVDDVTIEKLAPMLQDQPRGLLSARDELSRWLGGFNQYNRGNSDAARWIETFHGRALIVDRKSSGTIYVPRSAVSIVGGIQPGPLRDLLGREFFENGLVARLLLTMPPRRRKRWTDTEIDPGTARAYRRVVDGLYDLKSVYTDEWGRPEPEIIRLSADARAAWIAFFDEHAEEQIALSGDLVAAWSKLEAYVPRLALVIHSAREVAGDATLASAREVDEVSINAAVTLVRWFASEVRRVYRVLRESEEDRDRRHLLEKVQSNGGSMTPRDLSRNTSMTTEEATGALDELVQAGWGRWITPKPGRTGGRPSRRFVLHDTTDTDNTPDSRPSRGVSSVSVSSDAQSGDGEEWEVV